MQPKARHKPGKMQSENNNFEKGKTKMKYIMNKVEYSSAEEVAYAITENMDETAYDEMLDECYEEIDICGLKYAPSIALYRTDEIAYRCGMNDYYDSLAQDIAYEIDRMDNGDEEEFYGETVTAIDDEVNEDEEENE